MSYQDGWAALNLEMPKRVPRTEYSADSHWSLIQVVTGLQVDHSSSDSVKEHARQAFVKAWNYDFWWSILINRPEFGDIHTSMGHAVYADGGVDYDTNISSPFSEPEEVLRFHPFEMLGVRNKAEITARFDDQYDDNSRRFPECINMTGVYVTLVSGLIELFGWELLLTTTGMDPRAFGDVANRYASWIQQYFDALAESKTPVVMVHDDIVWTSGPFVHPQWYREYVFPNYRKLLQPLHDAGKKIIYTSDGTYDMFYDDLADCGVHGFVLEPTNDMALLAEKYGKTHVIIGNADTRVLLSGTKEQIRAEVERCMSIGKNCPGFFMAVGNHIPSNTPVENALHYNEVYEELSVRD